MNTFNEKNRPRNRSVKYVALQGGVYALEGVKIWDETEADRRAAESHNKLAV